MRTKLTPFERLQAALREAASDATIVSAIRGETGHHFDTAHKTEAEALGYRELAMKLCAEYGFDATAVPYPWAGRFCVDLTIDTREIEKPETSERGDVQRDIAKDERLAVRS